MKGSKGKTFLIYGITSYIRLSTWDEHSVIIFRYSFQFHVFRNGFYVIPIISYFLFLSLSVLLWNSFQMKNIFGWKKNHWMRKHKTFYSPTLGIDYYLVYIGIRKNKIGRTIISHFRWYAWMLPFIWNLHKIDNERFSQERKFVCIFISYGIFVVVVKENLLAAWIVLLGLWYHKGATKKCNKMKLFMLSCKHLQYLFRIVENLLHVTFSWGMYLNGWMASV